MVIEPAGHNNSDDEILPLIRGGDKLVYELFYKKQYKSLHMLAFSYVRRHEIAEEIVNDVFINIWNKASELEINQSFKNYIVRSVVNASINFLKKEKVYADKQEKYTRWTENMLDVEENIEEKELIFLRLEKALELLPPQCKKVMMMSRFEKLKQQEIADRLNISIKTVKNHLTYGFSKIRDILAADGIVFDLTAAVLIVFSLIM
ncbi:RNA polymerase sigma-70 factor [Desertivirga arenae]|uniref:RNA polymerase sigma-70 factor n=1 Tax=Desertivirga arenae TaxID=2810309 RepID=UPI001A96B68A|nr:RNA polymerase sigma-70 factor [Pedobacter sp. SYSU D00823]